MVSSNLHTKVNYPENKEIDPEDKGYASSIYEVDLLNDDKYYMVALGKPKHTFSDHDLVYYPIYIVNANDRIKGKVGVYEIEHNRVLSVMDEDGDVNISVLGEPLLFSYVTPDFLEKSGAKAADSEDDKTEKQEETENQKRKKEEHSSSDDEDDDDVLFIKKPRIAPTKSINAQRKLTIDDIFTKDKPLPIQKSWPEETEAEAKRMNEEFKTQRTSNDPWIASFMKNKNYKKIGNEGRGDCFFAVIRDAYEQLGYHTTIRKLREFLAQEVTLEQFEGYSMLYRNFMKEYQELEHEMDVITKANANLKKQSKTEKNKEKLKQIMDGALELNTKYQKLKDQKETNEMLLHEFQFMKGINSVEDFQEYIKTSNFWADDWAVTTMERVLDIKFIILEETNDDDAVMRCTISSSSGEGKEGEYGGIRSPKFYIMANYTMGGNHYELITYRDKHIFTFQELPYGVKILIVKKCMERNAGSFSNIPAFRQFQKELGVLEDVPNLFGEQEEDDSDLYDKEVVFVFHANSDDSKKPGKGNGEKIKKTRETEYSELNKKSNKSWRKMLDDSWDQAAFSVDGHRWASVKHYLLAQNFKSEPEVYKAFSLDSNSDISTSVLQASESIEKKKKAVGKYYVKYKNLTSHPTKEEIDTARESALFAKFSQNADLTTILLNTKTAKLARFVRGNPSMTDYELMKVRKSLENV